MSNKITKKKQQKRAQEVRSAAAANPSSYDVFDGEYKFVHTVPAAEVEQLPSWTFALTRLVVCRNHSTSGVCGRGSACKFIHLKKPLDAFPKREVHVSYAWRSLGDVTYPLLHGDASSSGGAVHAVRAAFPSLATTVTGDHETPVLPADAERMAPWTGFVNCALLLNTAGAIAATSGENPQAGESASICPDFFLERLCTRGSQCPHLHVVHVDGNARDFQRAPCAQWMRRKWLKGVASGDLHAAMRNAVPTIMLHVNAATEDINAVALNEAEDLNTSVISMAPTQVIQVAELGCDEKTATPDSPNNLTIAHSLPNSAEDSWSLNTSSRQEVKLPLNAAVLPSAGVSLPAVNMISSFSPESSHSGLTPAVAALTPVDGPLVCCDAHDLMRSTSAASTSHDDLMLKASSSSTSSQHFVWNAYAQAGADPRQFDW